MIDAPGWTMCDFGRDGKLERLAEEQQKAQADIVAMSALITQARLLCQR